MTRDECRELKPGMRCLIANDFVEDPHPDLREYLGTVQVVEKIDTSSIGWIYFKDLPQPFAMSEVVCVKYIMESIDDDTIPYEHGDVAMILGGV